MPEHYDTWPTGGRTFPFQDAFAQQLFEARTRVCWPRNECVFAPLACRRLEEYLISRLTFIAARVLGQEFYAFRLRNDMSAAFECIRQSQSDSFAIYRSFVDQLVHSRLDDLLSKYPLLRRHLAACVNQWVSEVGEIEMRLRADFDLLSTKIDIAGPTEQAVVDLVPGLSDPHADGRAVALLSFRGGDRLVYKPRTVAGEAAFHALVGRLNSTSSTVQLQAAWAEPRCGYGWMQFLCKSDGESNAYRYGSIAALLHLLCATDIHHENVINVDGWPVPVDLETILNPTTYTRLPEKNARHETFDAGDVLHSGILPRWRSNASGEAYDGSPYGLDLRQVACAQTWHRLNSDQMTIGSAKPNDRTAQSSFKSQAALKRDRDAVCRGFEDCYEYILEQRRELTNDVELLARFDKVRPRALLRDTDTYAAVIRYLLSPSFLASEERLEAFFTRLKEKWSVSSEASLCESVNEEILQLRRLDIPYLTTEHLRSEGGILRSEVFRAQLIAMSGSDRERQLKSIRGAFNRRFEL